MVADSYSDDVIIHEPCAKQASTPILTYGYLIRLRQADACVCVCMHTSADSLGLLSDASTPTLTRQGVAAVCCFLVAAGMCSVECRVLAVFGSVS